MTYEEAIEILQEEHDYCQEMSYVIKALDMAIVALERRIPKKPIIDDWKRVRCANEHNLPILCRNRKMPFCPFCGQQIDWSDDE